MTQCTRIPQDVINTYNQAYGEEYFYSLISDTLQRVSKKKNDNRQFRIFGNINQGFSVSRR